MSNDNFVFIGFGFSDFVPVGYSTHDFVTEGPGCNGWVDDTQLGELLYFAEILLALFGTPTTLAAMLWD